MQYNNLSIIGTSHISKHSVEEVKDHILTKNPDIIAIELDRSRAHALLSKKKKIIWF